MATKDRSRQDLVQAGLHVGYELTEFVRCSLPTKDPNAALEARLVHARTLIEFICGRPEPQTEADRAGRRRPARRRNRSDIAPADFGAQEFPVAGTDVEATLDRTLPLIDRHLSHLSWARVDDADEAGQWTPERLLGPILQAYRRFLDTLPDPPPDGHPLGLTSALTEAEALLAARDHAEGAGTALLTTPSQATSTIEVLTFPPPEGPQSPPV